MAFIVKDLMINVLAERVLGAGCGENVTCMCTDCTGATDDTGCGPDTPEGMFDKWWFRVNPSPEMLLALKQQLRAYLAQVEARETEFKQRLTPQTLEEAQALEEQLQEALVEVGKLKSQLGSEQSKSKKG